MRWMRCLVPVAFAALTLGGGAAHGQAKVFGLALGERLPTLPRCPDDVSQQPKEMCVRSGDGWTWVVQPAGRYPAWADYVSMRLSLGPSRRVDELLLSLHPGTKPAEVVESLTARFGRPVSALQDRDLRVWRWRGEGIAAGLVCSSGCRLEFQSADALREQEERAAAKKRVDQGRLTTP